MDIIDELIAFLGGKCALCHAVRLDEKKKRAWTIHHRKYKEGEKDSKDFKEKIPWTITKGKNKGKKTTKTVYHKKEYYEYIKPIVLKEPERFAPLHNSCHQAVTRLARWKLENLDRLYALARELK